MFNCLKIKYAFQADQSAEGATNEVIIINMSVEFINSQGFFGEPKNYKGGTTNLV